MVTKKISNLILVSTEKLPAERSLGDLGLDSMLAAEFRTFIDLLDKETTVKSLALLISKEIEAKVQMQNAS